MIIVMDLDYRPKILDIIWFSPAMNRIIRRILTKKVRAMASVDSIVANPVGHLNIIRKIIKLHRVIVPTLNPLLDADIVVELEGRQVATPHGASRVVSPADLSIGVGRKLVSAVDQLHGLNTLLAKTTVVEGFDGCYEIRIG